MINTAVISSSIRIGGTVHTAEDLLQQIQSDLEQEAEEVEALTGVNRREFVFMSVVAAAASTLGVPVARAQAGATSAAQP